MDILEVLLKYLKWKDPFLSKNVGLPFIILKQTQQKEVKISSDLNRILFDESPLSFFANTPFKMFFNYEWNSLFSPPSSILINKYSLTQVQFIDYVRHCSLIGKHVNRTMVLEFVGLSVILISSGGGGG